MVRTLFRGGRVFDGSGDAPADADVAIEDGRIVEVGAGLDGDEAIDCSGKALLPGLFDCHVHIAFRYEDFDEYRVMQEPFSMPFYRAARTCGSPSRGASPPSGTPPAPTRAFGRRWTREPSSVPASRSHSRCSR